jgi:hypothetical protein
VSFDGRMRMVDSTFCVADRCRRMRVSGPSVLDKELAEAEVGRTEWRERMTGMWGMSLAGKHDGSYIIVRDGQGSCVGQRTSS